MEMKMKRVSERGPGKARHECYRNWEKRRSEDVYFARAKKNMSPISSHSHHNYSIVEDRIKGIIIVQKGFINMSFYKYKDIIEEGDFVLAFVGRGNIKSFNVTKGEVFNSRYGNFEHDKMIGMKYGLQMSGAKGYGFIHLLHPTPEMWTISLPHRTQIVYTPDSSYIVQRLGITSGSRVIEAGTGSGSFSHAFARTLSDQGRLFSYEFHEPRYLEAKAEFESHGLAACNTLLTHRDVCLDGFNIVDIPGKFASEGGHVDADSVFLDLPSPWTAIPHLEEVVASDRRVGICCFSPCIEQVDKTVRALQEHGWTSIEMVEVAGKRFEARKDMVKDIGDVVKRLKDIQSRKTMGIESRRSAKVQGDKRAHENEDSEPESKKVKKSEEYQNLPKGFNPFGKGVRVREGDQSFNWINVTRVEADVKSHTSYLTFAYRIPKKA